MLKTKMQSPTSAIIISITAASGSSTQPIRSAFSPKVNQVKFRTARNPNVCSVGRNAKVDNARVTTWPMIASAAALFRRAFDRLKITSEAASGIAGISQILVMIQLFIVVVAVAAEAVLQKTPNTQHSTSNAQRPTQTEL